ncbi:maturation protein [ssRNA phage Esthiorhiza.2_16]|uniref:Maturation protein n=2 Tax=Leviviricetes TaxID=2842243 RepID=A0A8S5L1Y0_9VIRU|nr:maturation protein [ssRNA phage Esthiorhiza.2_16]QDH88020.1 MAG: hypothetical protein H2RhizoLitter491343_000003 [Leviviridae sp.]DAD51431.1 TPA_asm: maturation protein [ssRNA phage Esthiorhiza.2_16]
MTPRQRSQSSIVADLPYYFSWTGDFPHNTISDTSVMTDTVNDVHALGTGGDIGGPMDLTKITHEASPSGRIEGFGTGGRHWLAPKGVVPSDLLYEDFNDQPFTDAHSDLTMLTLGSTAISRTIPTNPAFSLSQALGELRADGVPRIPGAALAERTKYLKNSGDEYLNASFGWAPFVSDLRNFARTVKDSHRILKQYTAGSDKRIRRRYIFPAETYNRVNKGSGVPYPNVDANLSTFMSNGTHQRLATRETWFSGAFKYHIPVADDALGKFAEWETKADKLLGIEPTPKAVWELTPWSWAVDWFSNTGDVLNNISRLGNDGLVLEFGYVMCRYVQIDEIIAYDYFNHPGSLKRTLKVLKRRQATPYGFGFNMANLSVRQDAVLVALGLSKGAK